MIRKFTKKPVLAGADGKLTSGEGYELSNDFFKENINEKYLKEKPSKKQKTKCLEVKLPNGKIIEVKGIDVAEKPKCYIHIFGPHAPIPARKEFVLGPGFNGQNYVLVPDAPRLGPKMPYSGDKNF